MRVLGIPAAMLTDALSTAERRLERRPDGWPELAARGKLRRYALQEAGLADLVQAADRYLEVFEGRNPNLLTAANLYRLAGHKGAEDLLTRWYVTLAESVQQRGPDATRNGGLVDACFLLGMDDECQAAWAALSRSDPSGARGTRHGAVAALARGRANGDAGACDEAIAAFDAGAARERGSFAGTGGMNYYDWLEVALTVRAETTGEDSPRLRTL